MTVGLAYVSQDEYDALLAVVEAAQNFAGEVLVGKINFHYNKKAEQLFADLCKALSKIKGEDSDEYLGV